MSADWVVLMILTATYGTRRPVSWPLDSADQSAANDVTPSFDVTSIRHQRDETQLSPATCISSQPRPVDRIVVDRPSAPGFRPSVYSGHGDAATATGDVLICLVLRCKLCGRRGDRQVAPPNGDRNEKLASGSPRHPPTVSVAVQTCLLRRQMNQWPSQRSDGWRAVAAVKQH